MKSVILSCFLLLSVVAISQQQDSLAYYFDADGNPLFGSYKNLSYSPSKELNAYIDTPKFIEGSYTLKNKNDLRKLQKFGPMTHFYSNGQVQQECVIEDDEIKEITYYDSTGNVIHKYLKTVHDPNANIILQTNFFEKLHSDSVPDGSVKVRDYVSKRILYQEFENSKLTCSYYREDDQKIYQVTTPNLNLKLTDLQNMLIYDSRSRNYSSTRKENDYGYSLVLFHVNKKGRVDSTQHLFSTSLRHQRVIEAVLSTKEVEKYKLGKYLVDGNSVAYEVVIPINFKKVINIPFPIDKSGYPHDLYIPGGPNTFYGPPAFVMPR